jgi:hypothetical protein
MTDDKMLARIAALLRQAEGTDNSHEADAFMTAAQRLATAASIDLAVARSHSASRSAAQIPIQRTITIGNAGARGLRTYVQLFVLIASANDVRCDIARDSTFLYAYGFTEDIDATHALYRRSPRDSTSSWRSEPGSGSGWLRRASRRGKRSPRTADERRVPPLPCGTRRSSCATTTAARRRRAAPGRPTGRRPDTRRPRGTRVTVRVAERGSATAPSCPGRGARWVGDCGGAGLPARQGLRG